MAVINKVASHSYVGIQDISLDWKNAVFAIECLAVVDPLPLSGLHIVSLIRETHPANMGQNPINSLM